MVKQEEVFLSYLPKGRGHFEVRGVHKDTLEEKSFITTDTLLIDDALNSDFDEELSHYDTIDEARQCLVDSLF